MFLGVISKRKKGTTPERKVRDNPLATSSCGDPPSYFLKHGSGSTILILGLDFISRASQANPAHPRSFASGIWPDGCCQNQWLTHFSVFGEFTTHFRTLGRGARAPRAGLARGLRGRAEGSELEKRKSLFEAAVAQVKQHNAQGLGYNLGINAPRLLERWRWGRKEGVLEVPTKEAGALGLGGVAFWVF